MLNLISRKMQNAKQSYNEILFSIQQTGKNYTKCWQGYGATDSDDIN